MEWFVGRGEGEWGVKGRGEVFVGSGEGEWGYGLVGARVK